MHGAHVGGCGFHDTYCWGSTCPTTARHVVCWLLCCPGCPCKMTAGGSVCPAGYMCSWQPLAGHGVLATSSMLPAALDTLAVCAPCINGQYCPQGTTYRVSNDAPCA